MNGMDQHISPSEFILTRGYCMYCETPINDNDRCGCDGETIWYLTEAVEALCEAIEPVANAWEYLNYARGDLDRQFVWKINSNKEDIPGISFSDIKRAHDALEFVEASL